MSVKIHGDILDGMEEAECRAAFLTKAVLAISEKPDDSPDIPKKAWIGLFYWTMDLEALVTKINKMANRENPSG